MPFVHFSGITDKTFPSRFIYYLSFSLKCEACSKKLCTLSKDHKTKVKKFCIKDTWLTFAFFLGKLPLTSRSSQSLCREPKGYINVQKIDYMAPFSAAICENKSRVRKMTDLALVSHVTSRLAC